MNRNSDKNVAKKTSGNKLLERWKPGWECIKTDLIEIGIRIFGAGSNERF
jgi:hypothetical protein